MAFTDRRGIPSSSASAPARAAAESALWRMMSFYDPPLDDLDRAIAHDPAWGFPHVMKAGFLLSLTEPALVADAAAHLALARACPLPLNDREHGHLQAVDLALQGRWLQASRVWDALLIERPRDALALQWAHLWDFYRGDAAQLRARPARALPDWDPDDPLQPCVLGLYAFGLEECREYAAAEEAGRQALQTDPRVPWATHAVAHVMDMQGRFDDGAAWLRLQQPHWSEGNGFAVHLWWHMCLFRLETMDLAGALRLLDSHISGSALQITLHRVDAVAMLWRLRLLGVDVAERSRVLLSDWAPDPAAAGDSAFNDLHAMLALLAADDVARAETWVAACAGRVLAAEDAGRDNHAVARDVGLPLMRGVLAYVHGNADTAVPCLYAAREGAQRLGGSHAQRDLIDQTLLAACVHGSDKRLGRALLNERLMAKPATPLTRHWMAQIGMPEAARA